MSRNLGSSPAQQLPLFFEGYEDANYVWLGRKPKETEMRFMVARQEGTHVWFCLEIDRLQCTVAQVSQTYGWLSVVKARKALRPALEAAIPAV